MTENKRFRMTETELIFMVLDNETPLSRKEIVDKLNNFNDENEQLKQRNKRQYNQLVELWGLIENKNWKKLTNMVTQREEDEKRLQKEWKCYE